MSSDFLSKLERAFSLSAGEKASTAKHRRDVLRAGIGSETELIRVATSNTASPHLLRIIAWLLPRWPGGTERREFLTAARTLISHPGREVRAEAAVSLGLFRSPRAAATLIPALHDNESEVRVRAIASLGLHGYAKALPLLAGILADQKEPSRIRTAVCDAMSGFNARSTEPALVAALSDRSSAVRCSAAHSLGELRARAAIRLLQNLAARDPSQRVRVAARAAVARMGRK